MPLLPMQHACCAETGRSLGHKKSSASLMYWSVPHLVSAEMYEERLLFMHSAVHVQGINQLGRDVDGPAASRGVFAGYPLPLGHTWPAALRQMTEVWCRLGRHREISWEPGTNTDLACSGCLAQAAGELMAAQLTMTSTCFRVSKQSCRPCPDAMLTCRALTARCCLFVVQLYEHWHWHWMCTVLLWQRSGSQ